MISTVTNTICLTHTYKISRSKYPFSFVFSCLFYLLKHKNRFSAACSICWSIRIGADKVTNKILQIFYYYEKRIFFIKEKLVSIFLGDHILFFCKSFFSLVKTIAKWLHPVPFKHHYLLFFFGYILLFFFFKESTFFLKKQLSYGIYSVFSLLFVL